MYMTGCVTFFVNVRIHTILNDFVSLFLTYEVKNVWFLRFLFLRFRINQDLKVFKNVRHLHSTHKWWNDVMMKWCNDVMMKWCNDEMMKWWNDEDEFDEMKNKRSYI